MHQFHEIEVYSDGLDYTRYEYLEEKNIHKFTILSGKRDAVDEIMSLFRKVTDHTLDDTLTLYLIYIEGRFPSISYFDRLMKQFIEDYPIRPFTHAAIVSKDNATAFNLLGTILQIIKSRKRDDRQKFFTIQQEEEAIAWLLSEKTS